LSEFRQLDATDTIFIASENVTTYNHTAGLIILDPTGRKSFGFKAFRKRMAERVKLVPQFFWKMQEVPAGLDLPYWVEDEAFDIDRHIRRIAVPAPGDRAALGEVAGLLYSRHLDRHHPLWEMWLIEGLADGRVAVMVKFHHCLMDGQSAIRLLNILSDDKPNARARKAGAELPDTRAGRTPSPQELSLRTTLHFLRSTGKTTGSIATILLQKLFEGFIWRRGDKDAAPPFHPHPLLNADIGNARGFVFGSFPLVDLLRVKEHFGVTFNDVVLALASGALRRYLSRRDALPDESLRAGIAISMRTTGDEDFSNRVTSAPVTLATDRDDPDERVRAIHAASTKVKEAAHGGSQGAMEFVQSLPPLFLTALLESVSVEQAAHLIGAHVAVSNMRGNDKPYYIAGARIESTFPMSVIAAGIALNITCISDGSKLDVGLAVNPDSLSQPWSLVNDLEDELALLKKLSRKPARSGGRKLAVEKRRSSRRQKGR
jgi:WS/DGAT/MGAT family acyltransferase